jgi:hypothetical protein
MKKKAAKRTKANRAAPARGDFVCQTPVAESETARVKSPVGDVPAEQLTEVTARLDVGWGNALFIRGQGDGLSWDKGTPLVCADASTWTWSTRRASTSIVFKLLLNDQIWAAGTDTIVQPGRCLEVVPTFQQPAG